MDSIRRGRPLRVSNAAPESRLRAVAILIFGLGVGVATAIFAVVNAVLGVAFVATCLPARRACKSSPMKALRYE